MEIQSVIHSGIATGGTKATVIDAEIDFPVDAVKDKYVKVWLGGKVKLRKITSNTATTLSFATLGDATAATAALKAASAGTDTLTITIPAAIGLTGNELHVELTTAEDDTLAVTKDDTTKAIKIALADTTASKNAAATIQTAIRALVTVANIAMGAATCTAAGNWDTAAIATGEALPVQFANGANEVVVTAGSRYQIVAI